jgi:hypothetical protein
MNTFLKIVAAVCSVGIAAVFGITMLLDSTPGSAPAPTPTMPANPSLVVEAAPAPIDVIHSEPIAVQPTGDSSLPHQLIEELTAECAIAEGYGVSSLPLGMDWRTTERGVYSGSPVVITCETADSDGELTYEWSADSGEVQGSGRSIVWVAPGYGAKAQVSVVVEDEHGTRQSAALSFRVATCDCIFNRY